ncbi:MAG: PAS domain-containing sensor histidine kinase [Chloroflexi bacterium]|nr:PAS domain-containing sensor histidine kinase [Chloroflexota bacterium]
MFRMRRQQQHDWLKAILCSAAEAIFVTNSDWTITIANDSAQAVFGLKEKDFIGLKLTDFLGKWIDTQSWLDQQEITGEIEIDEAFFKYSVAFITEDKQEGYVCILTDITALKRLDALKTQMIRMASHDLRSPITSLRLQYYILKKQITTMSGQEHLERLRGCIDNLQKMVDKLLDIDWIEQQARGSQAAFSIGSLVESTISVLMLDAEFKQQHIMVAIAPGLPFICGDPIRLQEAFRNLLTNAIKYTPNTGKIEISAHYDNTNVYVSARDSGIGIAEDDLDKIFQAQFRAKNVSHIEGRGIGLSLAKAIVEDHGGQIWVESKLGEGSVFGFSLPINQTCIATR